MSNQLKVFVASSTEGLPIAHAIQQNLEDAEVTIWIQNSQIGQTILDGLKRNLQNADFGIFIFTPDDYVTIRGRKQFAVRDNVLLELGMFIGRLGKERSFIVRPKGVDMRLPTDLLGVITAKYDKERALREPVAALGTPCRQIFESMKLQHLDSSKKLNELITDALETICRFMASPVTPEQAGLRAFIFRKERSELVCRYFWDPYESEEMVDVTRFNIDKKTAAEVVIVKCVLSNSTQRTPSKTASHDKTEGGSVLPLSKNLKGVKGKIKNTLQYVLAAPIRNEDGTIWGVVDFDTSTSTGRKLLEKEKIANAIILRLARHLSKILAN